MNTTNGKIAEQSKKMLVNSLLTLMKQYDFHEITVTQIAQEADLSRKTYYRLFSDKQSLLLYLLEEKSITLLENVEKAGIHHYWDLVQMFFDFWTKERELLSLLKKHQLLYLLHQASYQHSLRFFCAIRSTETAAEFQDNLPYLLAYSIGGIHSMLLQWIEDDMKSDPKDFIETLHRGFQSADI